MWATSNAVGGIQESPVTMELTQARFVDRHLQSLGHQISGPHFHLLVMYHWERVQSYYLEEWRALAGAECR